MVPPIWLDEFGKRRPVHPCARCGQDAPILRLRIEHLRLVGWRLFEVSQSVNWCGHAQEHVAIPARDGWAWMVPIIGEAS
jgi:hypothetical protein